MGCDNSKRWSAYQQFLFLKHLFLNSGLIQRDLKEVLACQDKVGSSRCCPHITGLHITHPLLGVPGTLPQLTRGYELQHLWSMVEGCANGVTVEVVFMPCRADNISCVKQCYMNQLALLCFAKPNIVVKTC